MEVVFSLSLFLFLAPLLKSNTNCREPVVPALPLFILPLWLFSLSSRSLLLLLLLSFFSPCVTFSLPFTFDGILVEKSASLDLSKKSCRWRDSPRADLRLTKQMEFNCKVCCFKSDSSLSQQRATAGGSKRLFSSFFYCNSSFLPLSLSLLLIAALCFAFLSVSGSRPSQLTVAQVGWQKEVSKRKKDKILSAWGWVNWEKREREREREWGREKLLGRWFIWLTWCDLSFVGSG